MVIGDLNAEVSLECMKLFCGTYDLSSLIKVPVKFLVYFSLNFLLQCSWTFIKAWTCALFVIILVLVLRSRRRRRRVSHFLLKTLFFFYNSSDITREITYMA